MTFFMNLIWRKIYFIKTQPFIPGDLQARISTNPDVQNVPNDT